MDRPSTAAFVKAAAAAGGSRTDSYNATPPLRRRGSLTKIRNRCRRPWRLMPDLSCHSGRGFTDIRAGSGGHPSARLCQEEEEVFAEVPAYCSPCSGSVHGCFIRLRAPASWFPGCSERLSVQGVRILSVSSRIAWLKQWSNSSLDFVTSFWNALGCSQEQELYGPNTTANLSAALLDDADHGVGFYCSAAETRPVPTEQEPVSASISEQELEIQDFVSGLQCC